MIRYKTKDCINNKQMRLLMAAIITKENDTRFSGTLSNADPTPPLEIVLSKKGN